MEQQNLILSLRIQLNLVRFCLICGQSYGGLLSASLNHILSSPCFKERNSSLLDVQVIEKATIEEEEREENDREREQVKLEHTIFPPDGATRMAQVSDEFAAEEEEEEEEQEIDERLYAEDEGDEEEVEDAENAHPAGLNLTNNHRVIEDQIISVLNISGEDATVAGDRRLCPPSEQKFSCVFLACQAYFHSKDALKWHIKFSHSDIRKYCDVCGSESSSVEEFLHHVAANHERVGCYVCYKPVRCMERHLRAHAGERKYHCSYADCSQAFVHPESVTKHEKVHQATAVRCHLCPAAYRRTSTLRAHLSRVHGAHQPLVCTQCTGAPNNFTSHDQLIDHIRVEHGAQPCEYCGQKFPGAGLAQHIQQQHSGSCQQLIAAAEQSAADPTAKKIKAGHGSQQEVVGEEGKGVDGMCCGLCGEVLRGGTEEAARHLTFCQKSDEVRCGVGEGGVGREIGRQTFNCSAPNCHAFFKSQERLLQHRLFLHSPHPPSLECPVCHRTFSQDWLKFNQHFNKCQKGRQISFPCQLCSLTLTCHYDVIKLHYKYHAGARDHACLTCGLAFMEARTLRQHERCKHPNQTTAGPEEESISPVKIAACHICGKLLRKSNLKSHLRSRHREEGGGGQAVSATASYAEQFSCLLCGHATKTSWLKLCEHLKVHEETATPGSLTCRDSTCQNQFQENLESLHRHYYTSHKSYLECEFCHIVLRNRTFYETHRRTHLPPTRDFSCAHCPKLFKSRVQQQIHEARHTGLGRYACSLCGKRFPQRGELRNHEQQHGADKAYTCHTCGKGFARDAYLRVHMKSHSAKVKPAAGGGGRKEQRRRQGRTVLKAATEASSGQLGQVVLLEATAENLVWSNTFVI